MSPFTFVRLLAFAIALAFATTAPMARAQVVAAEPAARVEPAPVNGDGREAQVTLQLVVDADGHVESAVVASRLPPDASPALDGAAIDAVKRTPFRPSTRDGRPMRSRVEYVVVFPARAGGPSVRADAGVDAAIGASTDLDAGVEVDANAADARVASPATSASTADAGVASQGRNASTDAGAPRVAPTPSSTDLSNPGSPAPLSTSEQDEDYAQVVQVHGVSWPSPRGIGDVRIKRELLEASPRQQTSEMLSAAPGFFVDHEDGEGLGNDVYLRGFDLEHGSGIEMRVGNVPINNPVHVQGQGYADANFIIPEVVRSIRVLEGPFDPRQGDAAIVGSAYFDLGVADRGVQLKGTYGSFDQFRIMGVVAPKEADEETFAAFAIRKTDGFGQNRAAESATMNAQYGFDVGPRDHVRLLATAYGAREALAGVVRQADVDSGAIGFYDSYPSCPPGDVGDCGFAQNQGVQATRVILGADFDHVAPNGARFEFAPWTMWTGFRSRENFSGNIYSSALDPALAGGMGDLWELTNDEIAAGMTSRFHAAPLRVGRWLEATFEPGVVLRYGHTTQAKSLLSPQTLAVWDRRLDAALDTLDAGAYVDLDFRLWKRLRVSGGVRADLLDVSVDDRLGYDAPQGAGAIAQTAAAIPGALRATQGIAAGPRVTGRYDVLPELAPVVSYGEGFRSLDATANVATSQGISGEGPSVAEGKSPYSKVRSVEAGLAFRTRDERFTASASLFETWVQNELVFEATSGSFTTEGASVRRGVVGSLVAKPFEWLLASVAASLTSGTFDTLANGVVHYIPQVPPVVVRVDVTARRTLARIAGRPFTGRVGIGYTYLAGRYVTEINSTIRSPANNVLNASASVRYANLEVGVDTFNLLNLRYADDEEYYESNWSVRPGTPLATPAVHVIAAPPLSALGFVTVYF